MKGRGGVGSATSLVFKNYFCNKSLVMLLHVVTNMAHRTHSNM